DRSETGSPTYGRQVRYVPIHQLKAFADATAGPLHASIHTRYIGKRYVTSDESESLAPVFTMDGQLGLERTFGALRARLSLLRSDRSETGSPTYGRQVRYVPIHQLKAFADATAGPLHASIHTRYIGKRYVTSDESESLAPVFTMDGQLGLERTFGALRARLSLL